MANEFFLQSKLHGNVIDIQSDGRNDGAGLISWPRKDAGTENQRWSLVEAGDGFCYIRSALNGNVIDIAGGDRNPGARLISWPINTPKSDNQLWSVVPAGNGFFYLKSKLHGFVIDIRGGDRNNGAELITFPTNIPPSDNQLWSLVDATTLRPVDTTSVGVLGPQTISIPPGRLAFVFAMTRSSGVQSVTIKNTTGAAVFTANGKGSTDGDITVIGQGSFVSAGDGTYTIDLTGDSGIVRAAQSIGILRAAQSVAYQGDTYLTTYMFGADAGGDQAGDRDFNDLVVTIHVFPTAR